ncbi:SGNH/GDSL hydrolase family protein [Paenarthrobacter nicotinovorans]|uniref:SGNH/GDSL hydrolase family protein n=1 Tax=Paenarthrobacter nicotinovorans TaxID=29320 RepID=UPI0011A067D7|nr:SGNH/GDSL hydrolase family protein [Paenarthrobacter nicotinovorans]
MAKQNSRRRIPALLGGLAVAALTLGFTAAPATAAPPPPLDYVALGDSYTAGTGADGLTRTAVCWQSSGGYVDLVDASARVDLITNAACHGSLLAFDPLNPSPFYNGAPTVAEQIAGLAFSQALSGDTDLVSITAGAIDGGSLLALQACSTPNTQACAATVAGIIQNLGSLEAGLELTYQSIQAAAPNATIVVMGYPRLFDPSRGNIVIGGVTVVPVTNQITVNTAVNALNATIAKAVAESGTNAVFVDVTKRFLGHAVNSGNSWIVLDLAQLQADANFHPNDAGHQAYASALLSTIKPTKLVKQ